MCIISVFTEQMLVSLNIFAFIGIHVGISKGMEVNPAPQGKGMSQWLVLFFFLWYSYSRSHADTSRMPPGHIVQLRTRGCCLFQQLSVKMICKVPKKIPEKGVNIKVKFKYCGFNLIGKYRMTILMCQIL